MGLKMDQMKAESPGCQDEMRPKNQEQRDLVERNFKECIEIGDPKYMGVCPQPCEDENNRINDIARGLNSFVL